MSMWSLDSGLRACRQHKRRVVSFMFAVNIILGEISKVFIWSYMYLTSSEGAHSQGFRTARNSEDGYFSKQYALLQPQNPLFRGFYTHRGWQRQLKIHRNTSTAVVLLSQLPESSSEASPDPLLCFPLEHTTQLKGSSSCNKGAKSLSCSKQC